MTTIIEQILAAGKELQGRSTVAQQGNHELVLEWIKTLEPSTIPSTGDAATTYKCLIQEWVAIVKQGKASGTGKWLLVPTPRSK